MHPNSCRGKDAPATMEQGLTSAGKSGRRISAKFEMDDGDVLFSIYVERSDDFREVLINPHPAPRWARRSSPKATT
jgi:hypothetical protein